MHSNFNRWLSVEKWQLWKRSTLQRFFSHRSTFQTRCSLSEWMPHCGIVLPPHTDAFLIYSLMFIATAQLNNYVFVSYNSQNYITRLLRTKVPMCYLKLYKAVLIHANRWQASSCHCKVFATSVFWDWLIGWICAVALPSTSKIPGFNLYKSLIVLT